ncbi:alpha-galactosidase [Exiguobacterium aestuarii]|uniref:alpha-galactosidase n=1 Tax=Exiguobacterium aestuarii TaxID=273527 RepID=UPI001CD499B1|nr:alpha-galactosidase [Exiguobacterium aestuarii]MCA0981194.1 alpha-galactosidase [Exiguobacterium aestuarii]
MIVRHDNRFVLIGTNLTYVFDVDARGRLVHQYLGGRLHESDIKELPDARVLHSSFETPEGVAAYEFTSFGDLVYTEPTLKSHTETERLHAFALRDARIDDETLEIDLFDSIQSLHVTLQFTLYPAYDIIARRMSIKAGETVTLDSAQSFSLGLIERDMRLRHFSGAWTSEFQLQEGPLLPGKKTIESRRGLTSHQSNPWFALDSDATETQGEVVYGFLGHSGNWAIHFEKDQFGFTQVTGGINPFDFAKTLQAGESFTTPPGYIGYTQRGFGGMSQNAHDFERDVIMPEATRDVLRPVLYNSWEATYFDVSEDGQKRLVDEAAAIGCELFVVDDGWFGERHSDAAGLGDWHVNETKFPNGLDPLVRYVEEKGLQFGLWVEPEMVNPDSDLYRAHPEWIYYTDGRPSTTSRNQFVLNLALPEVEAHVTKWLDELLGRHDIRYIKWDMNRAFSEPDSPHLCDAKELWLRHAEAVYRILDTLRERHPNVAFESCAGGGGRIDLGVLSRVEQVWTSDNTDALDRLTIQEGFSYAYNAKMMSCWVTDAPNWLNNRSLPLGYRFVSAMQGTLGIGGNLLEWTKEELAEAKEWIATYKTIRPLVQHGTSHRLASLKRDGFHAVGYTDGEDYVVLVNADRRQYGKNRLRVKLRGLDPERTYELEGRRVSGRYLMEQGINLTQQTDYDAYCLVIHPA